MSQTWIIILYEVLAGADGLVINILKYVPVKAFFDDEEWEPAHKGIGPDRVFEQESAFASSTPF